MKSKKAAVIIFLMNCLSCSSGGYFENRLNDAKDVFNIGIEKDVYGGSVFIDFIGVGLQYAQFGEGIGMRYGTLGRYYTGGENITIKRAGGFGCIRSGNPCLEKGNCFETESCGRFKGGVYGNSRLWHATNYHRPHTVTERTEKKLIKNRFGFFSSGGTCGRKVQLDIPDQDYRYSYTVFPVELSMGFYAGVRIGFNIEEFIDFFLGIAGIDIMGDDSVKN